MLRHFKTHGAVHAFWVFAIMSAVIGVLLIRAPNGSSVNSYISFASSIASLILAVVAIFYSMISNQGFSETIGSLKSSVTDINSAATNINDISTILNDNSKLLLGEIVDFKPTIKEIGDKLAAQNSIQSDVSDKISDIGTGKNTIIKENTAFAVVLALYALAKSIESDKRFSAEDIVDSTIFQGFVGGSIETLRVTHLCDLHINKTSEETVEKINSLDGTEIDKKKTRYYYKVLDKGGFNVDEIFSYVGKSTFQGMSSYKKKIDDFFNKS